MMDYQVGDIVRGKVTGIEDYGIFVLVNENVTGLIHISEISSAFVKNVSDYVEMGEEIQAKIIGIDEENHKLKLSIKDFDYGLNPKRKKRGISETKSGFLPLKNTLPKWIESKVQEIDKNQKKV